MRKYRVITALRDDARKAIENLNNADIVIGIPAYYSQNTISHVIKQAALGLEKYYPNCKSLIFVADGGSTDDTREEALNTTIDSFNIKKLVSIYRGIPGKGSAVRAIFEAAEFLQAKSVVLFDSDLRSIIPEWVKNMVEPTLNGYDYVAPFYKRYKFDATITNTIAYNLTRALYGKRIRQPIGGDFAFSNKMVKEYMEEDVWESEIAKFGVDIWLTTTAIVKNAKICEARLGAKIHNAKDPSSDLSSMYREVVGTIFKLGEKYEKFWKKIKESKPVPIVGEDIGEEPEPFEIDIEGLIEYFKIGFSNFGVLWEKILDKSDFKNISSLAKIEKSKDFILENSCWIRIVYSYMAAFHKTPRQEMKLLETMIPLYNARVASLVNELDGKSSEDAEEYYERQAYEFEKMKDYLIKKWD